MTNKATMKLHIMVERQINEMTKINNEVSFAIINMNIHLTFNNVI